MTHILDSLYGTAADAQYVSAGLGIYPDAQQMRRFSTAIGSSAEVADQGEESERPESTVARRIMCV
jgi:hypothetical protein